MPRFFALQHSQGIQSIVTVTIDAYVEDSERMYACLECGERLPPRAKGGHREREYCSDRCRQRAHRKNQQRAREIERILAGTYLWPIDKKAKHDDWRFEREALLVRCKELEAERNVARAEVNVLIGQKALLEDSLQSSRNQAADLEAEIVRLNVLLEGQSRRTSSRPGAGLDLEQNR